MCEILNLAAVHHQARHLVALVRLNKMERDDAITQLSHQFLLDFVVAQTLFAEAEDFENLESLVSRFQAQ